MRTGASPEPLTFAKRVLKVLKERTDDFDIVHDNQTLATPLLSIESELGLPLVTTIHHPISFDRRIELEAAAGWKKKFGVWRWYSFVTMQAKVASQLRHVVTPSDNSKRDILTDFGVPSERVQTVHLGVPEEFVPPTEPRVPGRILAMASADAPLKGIAFLLEAFAKLRTERDLELVLVSKPKKDGPTEQLIEKLAIADHVRFVNGISDAELVELMGSAEIACVPSLYEGFSLPTAELMACGTPLVVSRAGAIPEVSGGAALLFDPHNPEDIAAAIRSMVSDRELRRSYIEKGLLRAKAFTWDRCASETLAVLEEAGAT